jgi:thymidine kinase
MYKLYFKYGVMGSSKSAQLLMTKFNYEQKGFNVLLLKPNIDNRDDTLEQRFVTSRIGLKSECIVFGERTDLYELYKKMNDEKKIDVVIIDEAQFCKEEQINQSHLITKHIPVLCYGLKTNFKGYLFEGSKRLLEIADSISEIKSVCKCGFKATMNAKFVNGKMIKEGKEIDIGGDEKYEGMCYNCWLEGSN